MAKAVKEVTLTTFPRRLFRMRTVFPQDRNMGRSDEHSRCRVRSAPACLVSDDSSSRISTAAASWQRCSLDRYTWF